MTIQEYLQQIDQVIASGKFKDTWESLGGHPTPSWFTDGKFGLFIHWGIYSVPAYYNEWYPKWMYWKGHPVYLHHKKTYGDVTQFGYKDFIPLFTAERFNADEWLDLFRRSGAQYIMPVGEHHDGFKMYDSDLSRWTSVNMGPRRDVLGELRQACDRTGMGFLASHHRAEHYFFLNAGRKIPGCDVNEEQYRDFYGPAVPFTGGRNDEKFLNPTPEWAEDWLTSACEMIDRYEPLAVYFDWWINAEGYRPYLKKFLAYYYNRAQEWGKEVTVFYKQDGVMQGCATFDIERGQFDAPFPYPWQGDTSTGKNSWGYTENNHFKTPEELVRNLIDVVSKNGSFMLNVGPRADGTICEQDRDILLKIGEWMQVNGEGIYRTQPYRIYAEGVKKRKNGSFKENLRYGKNEFRFTYRNGAIYAFAMAPSKDGRYALSSFSGRGGLDRIQYLVRRITALGYGEAAYEKDRRGNLCLRCDPCAGAVMPVCFKIEIE